VTGSSPLARRPGLAWAAAVLALAVAGCVGGGGETGGFGSPVSTGDHVPPTWRPSGHAAAGDTFVHLFEWRWDDVARECPRLAALGYRGVQISPPSEHLLLPGFPWYERYQTVSYRLDRSRSGTLAELRAMIAACTAAGVEVYADVVVNHLTAAASGTGSAGGAFSAYEYPGVPYTRADFRPPCPIQSCQDAQQVRACQLVGLQDLDTGAEGVRRKIAAYLVALAREGVAGFRVDAAKHVSSDDLDAILGLVAAAVQPPPWAFLEVIDPGGEAVRASDYLGVGHAAGGATDITEFGARALVSRFDGREPLSGLAGYPAAWGLLPSDKAVVFVANHDTERAGASYRDGAAYRLAWQYMLAHGYGHVSVLSGYAFSRTDAGPESDAAGWTLPIHGAGGTDRCRTDAWIAGTPLADGDWICQHRDPAVAGMVRFRREVAGADLSDFQTPAGDVVGFARGALGFAAFNAAAAPRAATFATRLPAGSYCNLTQGGKAGAACAPGAAALAVAADGSLTLTLPARSAIAIDVAGKL
jgi:alpha-amylase